MSKAWGEMRLSLAEYAAEIRGERLDREQQGRLALGWMSLWWADSLGSLGEEDWRKALGYSALEWVDVRDMYADVLDRGGFWCLRFMLSERERQEAVSRQQADRGRRSASSRANMVNGGSTVVDQRSTVVDGGSTVVNPASASALESTSKSLSQPPVARERSKRGYPSTAPEGFSRFWEAYACQRRTGKPAAIAAWKSLSCEANAETVLAELERFKQTSQWRDGFMPEPARWLKKAPWLDGPVPTQQEAW